jgi:hypothetical protein
LIPTAIVLSHEEQHARLRDGCPEALPFAHVIGDPCVDQLRTSLPFRDDYREAFGIQPGQKLILLTSTWGRGSLFGRSPEFIRRALAELPSDEYRFVAAIHPNAWHHHGGWQIRSWLKPCLKAGLLLPDPEDDTWKAAICSADAFIGDHGSLSLYAAALGVPGLLAAFDDNNVAPGSPMERLGGLLPRVNRSIPLGRQLAHALGNQPPDRKLIEITSRPGHALAGFRELCYDHLKLSEPTDPVFPQPVRLPTVVASANLVAAPLFVDVQAVGDQVFLRRFPAALQTGQSSHLRDAHVVAAEGESDPRWIGSADIVVARRQSPQKLFAQFPGSAIVADSDGPCVLHLRDGSRFSADWAESAWWTDSATAASALLVWLTLHRTFVKDEIRVDVGAGDATLSLRRLDEPAPGVLGPDAAEAQVDGKG